MKKKDKKGVSREGAGRVAIHRECPGLIHSYTLECNYCSGAVLNKIEERFDIDKRRCLADSEPVLDGNSNLYINYPTGKSENPEVPYQVRFSSIILHDIGRACLVAVLDLINANPFPRLSSVMQVKDDLLYELMDRRDNDRTNAGAAAKRSSS